MHLQPQSRHPSKEIFRSQSCRVFPRETPIQEEKAGEAKVKTFADSTELLQVQNF